MKTAIHPFIEKASESINQPRVQEMLEELSAYGLGICVPHSHDNTGKFIPLEEGITSFEEDLTISFHTAKTAPKGNHLAVGWRWNIKTKSPEITNKCTKYGHCD